MRRLDRARGSTLFRAMAEERLHDVGVSESMLEVALSRVLGLVEGLPDVVRQASFDWWLDGLGRFDACIPDWRVIVEADGRAWHSRRADFDRDRWRDVTAAANGFQFLRFSATHLLHRGAEVATLVANVGMQRRRLAA